MEKATKDNCAGKPIKSAMSIYSRTLLDGLKEFEELAKNSTDNYKLRIYNTACVLLSTSTIESKLNEFISIYVMIDFENSMPIISEIKNLEKRISLEDKWNLLAAVLKSNRWDNSKEPFQSFNIMQSLRNEITHYKGTPLGKDEAPTKKIKALMKNFCIESSASFIEDDVSTWINDLLEYPKLSEWININVKALTKEIDNLGSFTNTHNKS